MISRFWPVQMKELPLSDGKAYGRNTFGGISENHLGMVTLRRLLFELACESGGQHRGLGWR